MTTYLAQHNEVRHCMFDMTYLCTSNKVWGFENDKV